MTSHGPVAAREILVATNGYTGAAVPQLRRRVVPVGSYLIATAPQAEIARLAERARVDRQRAQPREPPRPVGGRKRLVERRWQFVEIGQG